MVIRTGVMGASVAFHLAERGVETLVLDKDGPAAGLTVRSGALVRAHYPAALEADLTQESMTGHSERWETDRRRLRVPGGRRGQGLRPRGGAQEPAS